MVVPGTVGESLYFEHEPKQDEVKFNVIIVPDIVTCYTNRQI